MGRDAQSVAEGLLLEGISFIEISRKDGFRGKQGSTEDEENQRVDVFHGAPDIKSAGVLRIFFQWASMDRKHESRFVALRHPEGTNARRAAWVGRRRTQS